MDLIIIAAIIGIAIMLAAVGYNHYIPKYLAAKKQKEENRKLQHEQWLAETTTLAEAKRQAKLKQIEENDRIAAQKKSQPPTTQVKQQSVNLAQKMELVAKITGTMLSYHQHKMTIYVYENPSYRFQQPVQHLTAPPRLKLNTMTLQWEPDGKNTPLQLLKLNEICNMLNTK